MGKEHWIEHITLMLKYLDDGAIRAVYMVVKEIYTLKQSFTQE